MSSTVTQTVAATLRSSPVKVSLNITSDTICPWCYIGYKQINRAIDQAKANNLPLTFDIEFGPFMLDPSLPTSGGQPKLERYVDKFGADRARSITANLDKVGKSLGINFAFGGLTSQTIASHRILTKAYKLGGQDAQQALLSAVFKGYFEQEKDVGDVNWLASCAQEAGVMPADEAKKFLESTELEDDVMRRIEMAQRMGITGVPFTIINGKWALSGAQPSEVFYRVFEKLAREPKSKIQGVSDGKACEASPGGTCDL